jgi:hypothetical protein
MRPVGKFFDSEETRQTVMGFLAKYMHLFDTTDRSTLLDVYSPVAVFSLTLFALNPVGVRAVSRQSASRSGSNGRQQRPAQHLDEDFDVSDIDFSLMKTARGRSSEWTNYDRNLHRVKDPLQRRKLSFKIPLDIAHTLAHLPKTIHKNPDTFVIDAWQIAGSGGSVGSNPIPPRLIMSVHGEFVEGNNYLR